MRLNRKAAIATAAAIPLMFVLGACAPGDGGSQARTFNFGHYHTEGPSTAGDSRFAELINERSGGNIQIDLHWSGALGAGPELWDLTSNGAVSLGPIVPHFSVDPFPYYSLSATDVWIDDGDGVRALQNQSELMTEVFGGEVFQDEMASLNLHPLYNQPLPSYYIVTKDQSCDLDSRSGKRARSLCSGLPKMLEAIGATPVTMDVADLYDALSRDAIDGVAFTLELMLQMDLAEVAQNVCGPIFMYTNGYTVAMNLDEWESLSPEQQTLFTDVAAEVEAWWVDEIMAAESGYMEELTALGVQFSALSDSDRAEWQSISPDFLAEWVASSDSDEEKTTKDKIAQTVRDITSG